MNICRFFITRNIPKNILEQENDIYDNLRDLHKNLTTKEI